MSGEVTKYEQDIAWLQGELSRKGIPQATEDDEDAFAERIAMKLENIVVDVDDDAERQARNEAFIEYWSGIKLK